MTAIADKESSTFLPISFDFSDAIGGSAASTRSSYYGVSGTPSIYIDGTSTSTSGLTSAINSASAAGASVSITGSVSSGVSGTVQNTTGSGLSNLTVIAFAYSPGQSGGYAVNTVKAIVGSASISSVGAGASENYNISGTVGSYKVVVAVFDSSKKCLNAKIVN